MKETEPYILELKHPRAAWLYLAKERELIFYDPRSRKTVCRIHFCDAVRDVHESGAETLSIAVET